MMRNLIALIVVLVVLFLFTGCSGGKDSGGQLKTPVYNPQLAFEIRGDLPSLEGTPQEFAWVFYLDLDSQGNIYLADLPSSSVKKYTPTGEFIKSFGARGTGPGELGRPSFIMILDDVVYLGDLSHQRLVSFDTEGVFLENIPLTTGVPFQPLAVGNGKFAAIRVTFQQTEKGAYRNFDLELLNLKMEGLGVMRKYKSLFDPRHNDFLERYAVFAVGKDRVYSAELSDTLYEIKVFDFNGKQVETIRKDFTPVPYNDEELKEINDTMEARYKRVGLPYVPIKRNTKNAINLMFYDKYDRLLVASPEKRGADNRNHFLLDVFEKGKYLGRVRLAGFEGHDFTQVLGSRLFFKGEYIFQLMEDESVVKVYRY